MIDRDFKPGGTVKMQLKDLDAAVETAQRLGVPLPLTNRVRQLFAELVDAGCGNLDHSALILRLEAMRGELKQAGHLPWRPLRHD